MGPDFHQDPTQPHEHQCGRISTGMLDFGCRHRWTHTVKLANSMKDYVAAHSCPQCGKGPWYYVIKEIQ